MPAQLIAVTEGPNILLDKPILLLGRHPECDIQIDSRKISRRHCCIAQVDDFLVVRENKTFQIKSVLQTGGAHGMCLLDSSLAELVKSGAITREEAARNAEDPARFLAPAPPAGIMPPAGGAPAPVAA